MLHHVLPCEPYFRKKNPQQGQHKKSKKKENRQTKRKEDRFSLGQNTQKPTYSLKTC